MEMLVHKIAYVLKLQTLRASLNSRQVYKLMFLAIFRKIYSILLKTTVIKPELHESLERWIVDVERLRICP